jgi:type IV secretory pathway VirB2 component (pilin)
MDYQQAERLSSSKGAPSWTNKISNSMICNYFYIFFVIFAVWAGLSLLAGVWIFASRRSMSFGMLIALIINIILSFGISATTALFLYLICDRALKPAMVAAGFEDMEMGEGAMERGQGDIEDGDE